MASHESEAGEGGVGKLVPLLPLRDIVVFPYMVVPLFVGREKSVRALEEAMERDRSLLLSAQRDARADNPSEDDIYPIGTLGVIVQLVKLPDGTVKVLVEGKKRARILGYEPVDEYFLIRAQPIEEDEEMTVEAEALIRSINASFETYVKLNKKIPPEMLSTIMNIDNPARLTDTIVAHLNLKLEHKQRILEITSPRERLEEIDGLMQAEIDVLQVEAKIGTRVKKQMERSQKEFYLNEQMRAIQKELGERDEFKNEIQELEEKLKQLTLPKEAEEMCEKEIRKLKMMSPMSAEATVVRNYIDWILSLPWGDYKEENRDIKEAER
ncbi:MAG: LON peptidase substrate-binding domain-containing protein, partial [Myxococcales bacterium]|nr:LON peptidase substrate-binding domain-containing protein [Myxococcales bacterium]